MLHCIKYELIALLRNKVVIFWLLGFPMILGTLFFAAFSNIADSEQDYRNIPVAVIKGDFVPPGFEGVMEQLSSGDDPLFSIKTGDREEAEKMMVNGELEGIIYAGADSDGNISLQVPKGAGIKSGIIKSVLDSFHTRSGIIADIAEKHPENLGQAVEETKREINAVVSSSNSANDDPYVQYFYNLLAMCSLMGATMGMYCAINHQANLSFLGARVEISPMGKAKDVLASLAATLLVHNVFMAAASVYLVFILGIDFGVGFETILLVNFVGAVLGDSMGCFIGSIGAMKEGIKTGILISMSLGTCFLSGLMFGGMRLLIEESCPIINRINPAALIVDCFYSICVYGSYEKFTSNIIILLVWCLLFTAGSLIMTRKRKYKTL